MKFNEDSRVKIPTLLHLVELGYDYLSLKNHKWDQSSNIFGEIFNKSIKNINPKLSDIEISKIYDDISICLSNEDLGKIFYEKIVSKSGVKLIDFENFNNNTFNVVTELPYKKDDDEFRPDITILINGMPLIFIEVKKPNNRDGILVEHKRLQTRFANKKFRNFINITQLIIFSNNMEYDENSIQPIQGAFYAATSYGQVSFNYFREPELLEEKTFFNKRINTDEIETEILKDNNLVSIKQSPEFITNKNFNTPTNKICTSLLQRERLSFLLQYGFAYVKEEQGIKKHVMRYPQIFATKAIKRKLEDGVKKGIIWHTQGSGKTALAFYNIKHLTHYFQKKKIIPKFYFIVDRIDLLIQASREFKARGLIVHNINSKEEFSKEIKSSEAIHNNSGKDEITVVNIQKFKDDSKVVIKNDYNINIQRIYFLDEVHRSYNPKGSFLANLEESDVNAIKIGLTGTPLIGTDYNSKLIFGDYIHKYYYNSSIADGYTLRLIREEIETKYKLTLKKTLEDIKILKGDADKRLVYSHPKFVEPLLDYIVEDFEKTRIILNENTIGGMVVCDTADQAREMYKIFLKKYENKNKEDYKVKKAALILHDFENKEIRKELIENYKYGKIDLLFVFNMLQTGFDSPRLKKIYIGRIIKSHNLLQTLTRVNRVYKNFKYGYVVDFANIQKEFEKTNSAYLKELQLELGDELINYSDIFKSPEEVTKEIDDIKKILVKYNTENAEIFSQQITQISNRKEMAEIAKALDNARELYNIIRLSKNYEILNYINFDKLFQLSREANNRLALINTKEQIENNIDNTNILNIALEDVLFTFVKVNEEEMKLVDELKNILQKTRESLSSNFDQQDIIFVSLKAELERLFKKKKLNEVNKSDISNNIGDLELILSKSKELERKNQLIKAKYDNDEKYARLHKRLMEKDPLTPNEEKLFEALNSLKKETDLQILKNSNILENEGFVEKMITRLIIEQLKNVHGLALDSNQAKFINSTITKEYINEFYGKAA
jgi:type I restriction enzyme R subunit